MGGRPRALDDTKRREICALISAGCGIRGAASFVGCNPITIRREAMRNPEFFDDLRKAELAAQAGPLQAMRKAANNNWRAAAWLLERTQPHTFGPRRPLHLSMEEVSEAIQVVHDVIQEEVTDREVLLRLWARINAIRTHFEAERHAVESPRPDVHGRRNRQKRLRLCAVPSRNDAFQASAGSMSDRGDEHVASAPESTSTDGGESP